MYKQQAGPRTLLSGSSCLHLLGLLELKGCTPRPPGTLAVSDISLAAAGAADCPELEAAPTPADDDQDKDATAGSVRGGVVGVWTAALLAAHLLLVACAQ